MQEKTFAKWAVDQAVTALSMTVAVNVRDVEGLRAALNTAQHLGIPEPQLQQGEQALRAAQEAMREESLRRSMVDVAPSRAAFGVGQAAAAAAAANPLDDAIVGVGAAAAGKIGAAAGAAMAIGAVAGGVGVVLGVGQMGFAVYDLLQGDPTVKTCDGLLEHIEELRKVYASPCTHRASLLHRQILHLNRLYNRTPHAPSYEQV